MSYRRDYDDPTDHTPEEWREMSRQCLLDEARSFERCDTDGFLSQWASRKMADRYQLLATMAENGGCADVTGLAHADDPTTPIEGARYVDTRYGSTWVYDGPDGKAVWFRPSVASTGEKRLASDRRRGYVQVTYRVRANLRSNGTFWHRSGPQGPAELSPAYSFDY